MFPYQLLSFSLLSPQTTHGKLKYVKQCHYILNIYFQNNIFIVGDVSTNIPLVDTRNNKTKSNRFELSNYLLPLCVPEQDADDAGWQKFVVSSFNFYHDKALKWGKQKPKRQRVNSGGWILIEKIRKGHNVFSLTSMVGLKLWNDIRPLVAPGWGSPSIITTLYE